MSLPTPKPRMIDVLDTLGAAIQAACTANCPIIPHQVGPGWVLSTQLAEILAQGNGNSATALWPLPETDASRFSSNEGQIYTPPTVTLFATVAAAGFNEAMDSGLGFYDSDQGAFDLLPGPGSSFIVTFTGIPMACNVHTVINTVGDAFIQPTAEMALSDVANALCAAVIALDVPGITALASGPSVVIGGALTVECNIGGIGYLERVVAQVRRPIQASIYSPDPTTRTILFEVMRSYIGTNDSHWLTMSDGQLLYVEIGSRSMPVEKAQSSYSAFEYHMVFETEYPVTTLTPVAVLGVVENEITENNSEPETVYVG